MGISEEDTGEDYMVFPDREGAEAYDDDDE
jgi:hypothetical protein